MKLALKLAFTVIIVAAIIWQLGNPHELGQLLVRIDPAYVLLILALFTLDRALMTYKWGLLLRSRGQQLPFFRGLRILLCLHGLGHISCRSPLVPTRSAPSVRLALASIPTR